MEENSYLILEDGSVFPGKYFGKKPPAASQLLEEDIKKTPSGEVVFNTGMTGYHEILTDPSYKGQVIVMTYPHIGNYGTDDSWSEAGPEKPKKSKEIKASGFVVRSLYTGPVPSGRIGLNDFLEKHNISGISDVDTRKLTVKIRDGGSPRGVIIKKEKGELTDKEIERSLSFLSEFPKMEGRNLVSDLGTKENVVVNKEGNPHICLIDSGAKANIIRELVNLGCKVTVVSNKLQSGDISAFKPDAVLFANGPGDPAVLENLIELAKSLIGRMPVFGICLGHQIISLALGAKTFKMKFGHHGVNNPVRDEVTRAILITSQNHGFSVDEATLPENIIVRFRNANDKTVEGIQHKKLPVFSVQFHPEAAPGPKDAGWIFKTYLEYIG